MIVLRCLLDVSGQFLGRPLSTLETSALRSDINEIAALSDLFLGCVTAITDLRFMPNKAIGAHDYFATGNNSRGWVDVKALKQKLVDLGL